MTEVVPPESETVEPVELLVQLAEDGEIEPWDIDIVSVTDAFLAKLDSADLRTSGRALFYASVLLRMKSDELLAEEEPDTPSDFDDEDPEDLADDPDAAEEDLDGLLLDDGPDPRSGRLVADDEGAHSDPEADLVAHDAGIDGGAATAEEAAVHVVDEDDYDIRSGD